MSTAPPRRPAEAAARFAGRSAAAALALGLAVVALGLLTAAVTGGERRLLAFDLRVVDQANDTVAPRPALVAVLELLTALGGSPVLWLVLTALLAYLLLRRRSRLAVHVAVTGAGALVVSPAAKELVGRLRPTVDVAVSGAGGPSFPSGHAFGSTVVYGVLLLVLWPQLSRRGRAAATTALVVLVGTIGATRVLLGVHYPTDVVSGWLLGVLWLAVTAAAFAGWRRDTGLPPSGAAGGLEPESVADLAPAPRSAGPPAAGAGRAGAVLLTAWVLLLGVLLALGLVVTEVLVGGPVDRVTDALTARLVAERTAAGNDLALAASLPGGTPMVVAVAVVAAAVALALTRRWRPVVFLAVVMVGEVGLFLTTATVIGRSRPQVAHVGPGLPPTASFPSGHLSAAIALYGALAVLVLRFVRARLLRVLAVTAAVALPLAVGLSRLYLGVHHPLDLLGSVVLAVTWLVLVRAVVRPARATSGPVRG